jgi:hypothetical protein
MADEQHGDPWRGQHTVPPAQSDRTAELPVPGLPARQSWWAGLDPLPKAFLIIAAAVLPLILCCGGLIAFGALAGQLQDDETPAPATTEATPAGTPTPTPTASPSSVVEVRTVTEMEEIPFDEETVEDSSLPEGTEEVRTEGVPGEKTLTYEVRYINGVETDRELVKEQVTKEPVTEVIAIGTRREPEPEPECDPNYAGACVPIASDVDCAGGGGDGPAYVTGPVRVVGSDIYDLDRDGDGIGCD